ncbi:MAG: hypothetical protein IKS48_08195 [Eubacterium sp.]|nr:hypothetical protein [Eubacterium sp.]
MENKTEKMIITILKTIFNSIAVAGVIIFVIGAYYMFIKAGLPYQDPPMELQIEYAVNSKIGDILTIIGSLMTGIAVVVRVAIGIISKSMIKPQG